MINWKDVALKETTDKGVCDEYRRLLEHTDTVRDAVALYKNGVMWALENNCPSLGLLRQYSEELEKMGIFIDKTFHGEDLRDDQVYIFHNCRGAINTGLNVKKGLIPMLYFANGCSMSVSCAESIGLGLTVRVPIHIFGDNDISAETSDDMVCLIHQKQVK